MPSLAAALLVGLTAMAVVPGAEGPAPLSAAPAPATVVGATAAGARHTAERPVYDQVQVRHEAEPGPCSDEGVYGDIAEYGLHLLERFFEFLRVDIVDGFAPALNALEASSSGHQPA